VADAPQQSGRRPGRGDIARDCRSEEIVHRGQRLAPGCPEQERAGDGGRHHVAGNGHDIEVESLLVSKGPKGEQDPAQSVVTGRRQAGTRTAQPGGYLRQVTPPQSEDRRRRPLGGHQVATGDRGQHLEDEGEGCGE
jgi:hypothetical protein